MSNLHRELQDDQLHVPKGHVDANVDSKIIKNLNSDHEYINESWKPPILDFLDITLTGTHLETNRARYALINLTGSIAHSDWDGASLNDIVEYFSSELEWKSYSPEDGDIVYDKDTDTIYKFDGTNWVTTAGVSGPAGSDTEVQFNNSGSFGASDKLTFNQASGKLTVGKTSTAGVLTIHGTTAKEMSMDISSGTVNFTSNSNNFYFNKSVIVASGGSYVSYDGSGMTFKLLDGQTPVKIYRNTGNMAMSLGGITYGDAPAPVSTTRLLLQGMGTTSGTQTQVWTNSSNATIAQLLDNGYFGIGSATPGNQLSIYRNDTDTSAVIKLQQDSTGDLPFLMTTGGETFVFGIDNSSSLIQFICNGDNTLGGTANMAMNASDGTAIGAVPSTKAWTNNLLVYNNTASNTDVYIENDGTGDAVLSFDAGSQIITIGIDNDASDNFKISDSTSLGSNDRLVLNTTGAIGVGVSPLANMAAGDVVLEGGSLVLKEITTPTADTNYGKVYTKSDNKLYFQDGAGIEHEIAFV